MTTNSLRWVVGGLCALIGALILVAPHQYRSTPYALMMPHLAWWGAASLVAGSTLLGLAGFSSSRRLGHIGCLLAAIVLLAFALGFAQSRNLPWATNFLVLAIGTACIPFLPLPRRGSPDEAPATPPADLFILVVGASAMLNGVLVPLVEWSSRPILAASFTGDALRSAALAILGLILMLTQVYRSCSRLLLALACLATSATFGTLALVSRETGWTSAACYYGCVGVVLALFPWIGEHLGHTDRVSLRRRLALALALAASLPLIVAATFASERVEQTARDEALAQQRTLATAVAQDIASYFGLNGAAVAALAAQPGLSAMTSEQQRELLRAMRRSYPDITDFVIFDETGTDVARSDDRPHVALAGTLVFSDAEHANGPWLDVLARPITGEPVFVLGAPIRETDGSLAGLVVGIVEAGRLTDSLDAVNTPAAETAYLVDARGRIIAQPSSMYVPSFADFSMVAPVAALLNGNAAAGSMRYDGPVEQRLAGWAEVPGLGWSIVTERPTANALASVHAGRELIFEILLLVVGSASGAGIVAAGWLAAPLRSVTEAVDRFAAGDSGAPLPHSRIAEVARLTAGFGELRDRLAERTAERERAEVALQHEATHDALTGLPNRALLNTRLHDAVKQAEETDGPLTLLLMDLNRFKEVNDTLGHQAGDVLLQQVAQRLQHELRAGDTVARLGGDEFSVILPQTDLPNAVQICRRLLHALEQPFSLDGHPANIGGSIGVALWPVHGRDSEALMRAADVAMYVAKRSHAGYTVFAEELDDSSPDRLTLLGELRAAIDENQLALHYQPTIDMETNEVLGVEALVRWNDPKRGLVGPDQFIPLMDQLGLSGRLSDWVLNRALEDAAGWHRAGLDMTVAVNLSAQTLHDPALVATVAELLARWEIEPTHLMLEITESSIMVDPQRAADVLAELRVTGVQTAIDDFGTGYSSLSYIKRLPMDALKIDQSFVRSMTTDSRDWAIVRSAIELGHNLGFTLVAEGVEDYATYAMLASLGCNRAQGFCISGPLPANALVAWLPTWTQSFADHTSSERAGDQRARWQKGRIA